MSRKSNQPEENQFIPTNSEQFVNPSQTSESFEENSAEVQNKIPFRNIAIGFGGVSAITFAAGFGGMLMLRQPSPEVVAITCQTAKDWNKNQTNSLQSLAQRQEENATQAKKENKPVAEAKVLGTITALEFVQIQKEIASLDLTKDASIPFFTSNFIKVLKVIDSENILDSQEQMRLLSFYHQSYRNVEWDKPTSESYVGFINAFNTKAEELRQVSFGALAENNCETPIKAKIVDSKTSQTKETQNYTSVANAIKQESDFRPVKNVGLVKAVGVHNQLIEKINNENKGGKDFKQAAIFVFNDGRSQVRINASRKDSNPTPSEQNARILLNLSNLVSPDRNLSQDQFDRIAREIEFFMNDVGPRSKLNTPEQYQENLMGLVNRIVGIDQEIKQDIEKSKNGEKYLFWLQVTGVICGLGAIGSGLGHLKQHSNNKKQQTKIEVLETGVVNDNSGYLAVIVLQDKLAKVHASNLEEIKELKNQLEKLNQFYIGKDEEDNDMFASKEQIQNDASMFAKYLSEFAKSSPGTFDAAFNLMPNLNPEMFNSIKLLEFKGIEEILGNLKKQYENLEGLSHIQFESSIKDIMNFVYILQEFACNVTKENTIEQIEGVIVYDEIKAIKLKIKNEYLPQILMELKSLVNLTKRNNNKVTFKRRAIKLLDKLDSILVQIPESLTLFTHKNLETILTESDIKLIKNILANSTTKSNIFEDWVIAQSPSFDIQDYMTTNYLSNKNVNNVFELDSPESHINSIEADVKAFEADCEIFFSNFEDTNISKELLIAYYENTNPKSLLDQKAEYFAGCKTELQILLRSFLSSGIISNIFSAYNPSIQDKILVKSSATNTALRLSTSIVNGDLKSGLIQTIEDLKNNGIHNNIAAVSDKVSRWARLSQDKVEKEIQENSPANEQIIDVYSVLDKLSFKIKSQEDVLPQAITQYNTLVIKPLMSQLEYIRSYIYKNNTLINDIVKIDKELAMETDANESGFLVKVLENKIAMLENDPTFKEFTTNLKNITTQEKLQNLKVTSLFPKDFKTVLDISERVRLSKLQIFTVEATSSTKTQLEIINQLFANISIEI